MKTLSTLATSPVASQLGDLPVKRFLSHYWQRRPLLIRQAFKDDEPQFIVRDLLALARDENVESRLVQHKKDGRWLLHPGPFARLPPRRQPDWTLLVQGVDLHLASARALMDRFRFVPDARLDDLMISFATDGGGVGPHVDSYDVFLLQVHGRRRWRIAQPGPTTLLPDAPLRILAQFTPEQEWLLDEGDMLYLPPGWAHDGTAVGECMTCSIGFRSPSVAELRQAFFAFLADGQGDEQATGQSDSPARASGMPRRYRDRTRTPVCQPAEIPADMADTLRSWITEFEPPALLIDRFIGCFLSEPKPNVWFEGAPDTRLPVIGEGLALDRRTRMLYRKGTFYINGEALRASRRGSAAQNLLIALADQRGLDAAQTAQALRQGALRATLAQWLTDGWLIRMDAA